MTSDAKGNHRRMVQLMEGLDWFGRGRGSFRLFRCAGGGAGGGGGRGRPWPLKDTALGAGGWPEGGEGFLTRAGLQQAQWDALWDASFSLLSG